MMRFAFYVSGKATRLKKILDGKNHEILEQSMFVFSDDKENEYLKLRLTEIGIDYLLQDYKSINEHNSSSSKSLVLSNILCEYLNDYKIDYCFCFGDHILQGKILYEYKNRIINFHPSLLPLFPGRKAIDQAITANVSILGNTAHFIDKGIDTGPVIMQSVVSVRVFHMFGYDGVLDIQVEMLYKIYELLIHDRLKVKDGFVEIIDAGFNDVLYIPNII